MVGISKVLIQDLGERQKLGGELEYCRYDRDK
jgi:hypothetical protein